MPYVIRHTLLARFMLEQPAMHMKTPCFWRIAPMVFASWLAGAAASAQTPDVSALPTAQVLFDAAIKAMDHGDYAAACPKLEEVVKLVPEGMGAKLTLATCYEGAGKLASSWTLYTVVAASAREEERVKSARKRAAALRPRLAELTIQVPDAIRELEGLQIRREGIAVGPAQWGMAIPIDKGVYLLSATANGKRTWMQTVHVDADGAKVEVVIGPLQDQPTSQADGSKAKPAPAAQEPAKSVARVHGPTSQPARPTVPSTPDAGSGHRIAGVVVGGIGIAVLAAGGIAGGLALGKQKIVDDRCDNLKCDETGWAARESGRTLGNISTAGFAVGLAGLATGVVLVLTAPSAKAEVRAKPELRAGVLRAGATGAVLGMVGAF
jgi:hypothetical protein